MKPVAILGSGPAGLLAAHAVGLTGHPLAIFSKPVKSELSGAQFLHRSIPDLTSTDPDVEITYRLEGTPQGYREKVYGSEGSSLPGFVSFEFLKDGQTQDAWNLLGIYDRLWQFFQNNIEKNATEINNEWIMKNQKHFEFIISTIPLPALCETNSPDRDVNDTRPPHIFQTQGIWLIDDQLMPTDDNTILYNGNDSYSWYRTSNLFGHKGTEWSQQGTKPPYPGLKTGIKPIRSNCNCHPEIIRLGRFGKWEKGVLTHHAFEGAMEEMLKR